LNPLVSQYDNCIFRVQLVNHAPQNALLALYVGGAYVGLPASLIWGWVRWARRKKPQTAVSILSLIGFTLTTTAAVLALSSVIYAEAIGGFPFYDPRLITIYRWGGTLAFFGIVFGISGAWSRGPLRWHAPFCAAVMLMFWILAAFGE
jgi:hypothetical protein